MDQRLINNRSVALEEFLAYAEDFGWDFYDVSPDTILSILGGNRQILKKQSRKKEITTLRLCFICLMTFQGYSSVELAKFLNKDRSVVSFYLKKFNDAADLLKKGVQCMPYPLDVVVDKLNDEYPRSAYQNKQKEQIDSITKYLSVGLKKGYLSETDVDILTKKYETKCRLKLKK